MNAITHWDPLLGLSSLQAEVNRLFDGTPRHVRNGDSEVAVWAPSVDIFESESELVVKADLPGLEEKDIDVRTEKNVLTIRGERKLEKNVTEDNYLRVERAYGAFARSFSLPNTINSEQIQASYQSGVLTVRMPKREESKPKQIKINVSGEKAQ